MFNLHYEKNRQRALDDMLYYKVPALKAILQLVQDSDLRPRSIFPPPVFNNFRKQLVVGSISIVFSWDDVLKKLLPSYINGIVCVIRKILAIAILSWSMEMTSALLERATCMIHCMIPWYTLLAEVLKEQKMVSLVLWKIWSHTNWRSTPPYHLRHSKLQMPWLYTPQ